MSTSTTDTTQLNGLDTAALDGTLLAVSQQPELARVQFSLNSEWLSGCRQRAVTGDLLQNGQRVESRVTEFVLESDEPEALLGTDAAASPAEFILQALAGCYAVTFVKNAAVRKIKLTSLRFALEADFDLQGFLDLSDEVRPGAQEIRIAVTVQAPDASADEIAELVSSVERQSPIRDTLAHPVAVRTSLVSA